MIDRIKFEEKMKDNNINYSELAQALGITRSTMSHKVSGNRAFSADEVLKLAKILHISGLADLERIFFAKPADNKPTCPPQS